MFKPKPLYRTYTLCGYTFDIYDITGFDFKEQLDLPDTNGVYCFTSEYNTVDESHNNIQSFKKLHFLLYLGRTKDFSERFEKHHKNRDLTKICPLYIGICYCNNANEEDDIEKKILSEYSILLNKIDNIDAKNENKPMFTTED